MKVAAFTAAALLLVGGCVMAIPVFVAGELSKQYIPSNLQNTPKKELAKIEWAHNTFIPAYTAWTVDGTRMKRIKGMFGHTIYVAEGTHTYTEMRTVCRKTQWVGTDQLVNVYGQVYSVVEAGWFVVEGTGDVEGQFNVKAGVKYNWFKMEKQITECECRGMGYEYVDPPKSFLPLAKFVLMSSYRDQIHPLGLSNTSIQVFQKTPKFRKSELVQLLEERIQPTELTFSAGQPYTFQY